MALESDKEIFESILALLNAPVTPEDSMQRKRKLRTSPEATPQEKPLKKVPRNRICT